MARSNLPSRDRAGDNSQESTPPPPPADRPRARGDTGPPDERNTLKLWDQAFCKSYPGGNLRDRVRDLRGIGSMVPCSEANRKREKCAKSDGIHGHGTIQRAFKLSREQTSSSSAGLHYTIWKAMAEYDYLAEFQCVMLRSPFVYGFVCKRWLLFV